MDSSNREKLMALLSCTTSQGITTSGSSRRIRKMGEGYTGGTARIRMSTRASSRQAGVMARAPSGGQKGPNMWVNLRKEINMVMGFCTEQAIKWSTRANG